MKKKRNAAQVIGRKGKLPPCVRVVENVQTGKRRALWHSEHKPRKGEKWIGIGSYLLNLPDYH